ncbi:ABC transporter ATP-binding protein [Leucobacter luti]|uniref:ABC transporter ATP-binding protein n=1 Tax=Leucobacter luti TaxID=340320 RepID=UPI0010EA3313|nr:ABC transporter ATP-binding protein [Leucobacter luti]MCW2289231.1 ABC-type Fe3+/spermidine/putrescine transport system ATPase subunit [Leucobacter luti]QYM74954.1 ABC transporter ATP-binding protein [Leucobacter luti]TCK39794.1 putative spermidine/putrescine transport system ATP-binding protein/spermidine/putrescine transport system ATP-binding protein [Leucobacter luti]
MSSTHAAAPTAPARGETKRGEVIVDQVSCDFSGTRVLHETDLTVEAGEFFTLLGPSGSGKTTLLRIIAGLIDFTSGRIAIDGADVTKLPTQQRDIGFVFQNYALFPHLTVAQNIAFGLKIRKVRGQQLIKRVDEILELTELGALKDRHPAQLSGGQQQRVALGRALAQRPRVLLLDEPLGALDRRLRQDLGSEIRRIQQESETTAIYVTHDQEEAYILSDRMGVMEAGYIRQVGAPREVYSAPNSGFVANFLGETNSFAGEVRGREQGGTVVRVGEFAVMAAAQPGLAPGAGCIVSARPEQIRLSATLSDVPAGYDPVARVTVTEARFFGQSIRVRLADANGSYLVDLDSADPIPEAGSPAVMSIRSHSAVLLPPTQ